MSSLGRITERSAQKEIEASSISYTPQKEKPSTPARFGSKLKAPTAFSLKQAKAEHDRFLQFVQDSDRARKSSPRAVESVSKQPEASPSRARGSSTQQKESVNRLQQKTPIKSRRLTGSN